MQVVGRLCPGVTASQEGYPHIQSFQERKIAPWKKGKPDSESNHRAVPLGSSKLRLCLLRSIPCVHLGQGAGGGGARSLRPMGCRCLYLMGCMRWFGFVRVSITIQKPNDKPFDLLAGNRLTQTVPSKENRSPAKRYGERAFF